MLSTQNSNIKNFKQLSVKSFELILVQSERECHHNGAWFCVTWL